ncbi:MAG: UDP-glucose 4-epimerase GalE [Acidimicrobiales bacterium]
MKVLVAGGAGFIGSTIASACLDEGVTPVILDNLITGRREFARDRIFYEGDIADAALVARVFDEHPEIESAILLAALISVPESVKDPIGYYDANVVKALGFVRSLRDNACTRLIFSSSASVYGTSDDAKVDEDAPLRPESPYARTKATCEVMFRDVASATDLRVLSLRYFNPIGADPQMRTGLQQPLPTHALGQLIRCHASGEAFQVTGTDYPTRDGTGIRDYIHVWDVARAHVAALSRFDDVVGGSGYEVVNLGTGLGTTVRELVDAFNGVVATPVAVHDAPRRPGDVAGAFASREKAERLLGWVPERSLVDGVRDSLEWSRVRASVLGE